MHYSFYSYSCAYFYTFWLLLFCMLTSLVLTGGDLLIDWLLCAAAPVSMCTSFGKSPSQCIILPPRLHNIASGFPPFLIYIYFYCFNFFLYCHPLFLCCPTLFSAIVLLFNFFIPGLFLLKSVLPSFFFLVSGGMHSIAKLSDLPLQC